MLTRLAQSANYRFLTRIDYQLLSPTVLARAIAKAQILGVAASDGLDKNIDAKAAEMGKKDLPSLNPWFEPSKSS